ncbi:MAG: hypothetical protein JO227_03945 [Acetobacteraceae bacterium]|nr:hypothetical protein [Acetobacteraceae bacterium]
MTEDGPWLNIPQAVVLEATGDIKCALDLTGSNPGLLVLKANKLIALRTEVPLEADAAAKQRHDAVRKLRETRAPFGNESRYEEAQQRVLTRLAAGVRTKASRTPGGPYESVDPVEFTRVELRGVDAIDKRSGAIVSYDLRVHGSDYIKNLRGKSVSLAAGSSPQKLADLYEHSSREVEKWDCAGDPLPKLTAWARSRWGEDIQNLPNRQELLLTFRGQFGRVLGISEKTMREVRRELASPEARRGGARMHRR